MLGLDGMPEEAQHLGDRGPKVVVTDLPGRLPARPMRLAHAPHGSPGGTAVRSAGTALLSPAGKTSRTRTTL